MKPNPHADMPLMQYIREVVPQLKPDARQHYLKQMVSAGNSFCSWVGGEIAMADIQPEMVDEFVEQQKVGVYYIQLLRRALRCYDPKLHRIRKPNLRRHPDTGNGSPFLLTNVYLNQYEPLALRTRRPNTKRLYKTTLRTFDKFLGRNATLDDLNDETVSKYADWRKGHVHARSVNKDLFNLLAIWRWCNRKGLVDTWPDVQLEQPPKRTPVAWSEKQIKKLFAHTLTLPGRVGQVRANLWWPALLLVAWDSAERILAIMELTWERVDLDTGWVRFAAEHRKGGVADSSVKLSKDTVAALKKIRRGDGTGLVFDWPYSWPYLWQRLGKIQRDAGLPADAQSKFHRIRRTVASFAEAAGANATAMLRHSKREITESYLDPKIVKRQQPADVLFRLAK